MSQFDTHEIKLLREEVKNGLDIDEAIRKLHRYQYSITESMKFLVSEYRIGLGEAKNQVSNHPVWHDVVEASKPLHDDLVEESQKNR
jgi:hypothetical protein